jgi:hypothetical protein
MQQRPVWLPETRDFIGLILICAMVGLMFVMVLRPSLIPPDSPVVNMLIGGFMTVGFSAVIQFYFGSSKGSVAKDDTINAIATTQAANGVEAAVIAAAPAQVAAKPAAPPAGQVSLLGSKA